jgi:hypothetical protein
LTFSGAAVFFLIRGDLFDQLAATLKIPLNGLWRSRPDPLYLAVGVFYGRAEPEIQPAWNNEESVR